METIKGKFITIEGSEGVGKSTNIEFIQNYLAKKNIEIITTREPGGTPLSEEIRNLLLANREESVDETTELLLMFAARSQHLKNLIIPKVNAGAWILCDRFTDSTFAYQGGGRGLSFELIAQLEEIVQQGLQPDLTLYLDIDVKLGLERAGKRGELDRFEIEKIDFFERVRSTYLHRAKANPDRYKIIDASQSLVDVQSDIASVLDACIK